MIYNIQYNLITDLASEPIDVPYLKQQARIDFNADDALLQDYITAARLELEEWSGLAFGAQTWQLTADWLPNKYRITKKEIATLDAGDYTLTGQTVSVTSEKLYDGHIKDVDLTFTTKAAPRFLPVAKVAIAKLAASKYAQRYNVMTDMDGKPINASDFVDEAKKDLQPFKVVILC